LQIKNVKTSPTQTLIVLPLWDGKVADKPEAD